MALIDLLNSRTDELKKYSQEELDRIDNLLITIKNALDALNDEEKLKDYNFDIAISLVNSQSFGILDLSSSIKNIKNVLIAKYVYHQDYLSLSEEDLLALKSFKERLGYLKEELENRKMMHDNTAVSPEIIENLDDLRNLLQGKGRRKYYTYEMLEALFEVIDYDKLSLDDMKNIVSDFKVAKNFKNGLQEEKVPFDEVINVYKDYFSDKFINNFLKQFEDEICSRINLVNVKNILEFFKKENILNKFSEMSLLQITLYGKYDFIEKFYYEKVLPKKMEVKEIYFEEIMACVWINEKSSKTRKGSRIRITESEDKKTSIHSMIKEVCDDDIWENVRLIKENNDLLADKYDLNALNYLWVLTKPTWQIKKNLTLFRMFNMRDIKITALGQMDLEDKIHLAVELGLLNGPRTHLYQEMETRIPRYNQFMLNARKKKRVNESILNYYSRNTSSLGKTAYTEFIYMFYKLLNCGREEFFQSFFSENMAGMHNQDDFFNEEDRINLKTPSKIERIIDDNFVTNYYDTLIYNYDEYDTVISEFSLGEKSDLIGPYYDNGILNDPLVIDLEDKRVNDYLTVGDEKKYVKNEYVYMFGDTIISRYKVLRNLSILKNKYGYLNEDMVLTAIVRNSYIGKMAFTKIKDDIMKGSKLL